ncbi:MAG: hypothetical protein KIT31_42380 [Deltaproteobacteria bacterium]|nr:hypothetical protein [Deltaproteobacteria bacterium]
MTSFFEWARAERASTPGRNLAMKALGTNFRPVQADSSRANFIGETVLDEPTDQLGDRDLSTQPLEASTMAGDWSRERSMAAVAGPVQSGRRR